MDNVCKRRVADKSVGLEYHKHEKHSWGRIKRYRTSRSKGEWHATNNHHINYYAHQPYHSEYFVQTMRAIMTCTISCMFWISVLALDIISSTWPKVQMWQWMCLSVPTSISWENWWTASSIQRNCLLPMLLRLHHSMKRKPCINLALITEEHTTKQT